LQARFRRKRENDCTGRRAAIPKVVNAGSTTTSGTIRVAAQDGFNGTASLTCSITGGSGSCSGSSDTVYENDTSIGGPTSTSFAVTAQLPSTPQAPDIYNFQIEASDAAGISSPSGAVTVTTLQAPTHAVRVAGVSGALSHSTTLTLIVLP
jgi:hypothetical protein